ncbi:Hypothetical predicted protein [Prunus dulcis]|uniref:Uncharacterized protein n=1 Tax=Prunus dulcis TaxID=3755 RepID=A0A5E4GCQ1_PRUDU|nr:Hypothetical predicted protein [Prunus dulcis]
MVVCPWPFLAAPVQAPSPPKLVSKPRNFVSILFDSVESSVNLSQPLAPVKYRPVITTSATVPAPAFAMIGKIINVAVNNELEAIAHAVVSKDVVVYEEVVVSSGEQRGLHMQLGDSIIGGTASDIRDTDLALGSPIQGSPPQTTSNF